MGQPPVDNADGLTPPPAERAAYEPPELSFLGRLYYGTSLGGSITPEAFESHSTMGRLLFVGANMIGWLAMAASAVLVGWAIRWLWLSLTGA